MKKMLIAGAMVLTGLTGMAKAADMKYVDVPSGHWAYDAIKIADEAGCWKGYPDGTFRGNRNITRYEMAMLIARIQDCVKVPVPEVKETAETPEAAKLVEKDEKALAETKKLKALVDKLQAEFKDELAALKTQVKKNKAEIDGLWKDQKRQDKDISKLKDLIGNVKLSGTLRTRIDSYGSDLNARNSGAVMAGDPIVGALAGAATVESEYGYELFYDVLFSAKAGENVDVLVEFNNWAQNLSYGTRAGTGLDRTPNIDQAYAALDLTSKTQSLDSLKVTLGTQYYAFGPRRLLVDNGWASHPTLRVDVSKDLLDLTAIASLLNQDVFGGVGVVNPVRGGAGQDALAALRLGLNLKPAKVGINYLASGAGAEKAWGVDLESPLLRNTNWFNGVSAEFIQITDDQAGSDPGCAGAGCTFAAGSTNDEMDTSFMVALDVYKSKKTLVNAYYADIGLTPGYSGAIANPFNEFNAPLAQAGGNMQWGYQLNPFLFDSYQQVSPDFEGFGAKVVHSFSKDVTVSAIARKGDLNSAPTLEYPAYGALRVAKGINDDTTFAIDYAQYGGEDIYINRLRGELVVNF